MIQQFKNFESAALAAAKLRSRGHFARVCEESSGFFWGPAAVGGVRVISSDEPLEEEDYVPLPESGFLEIIFKLLRFLIAGLIGFAACYLGYLLLNSALSDPLGSILVLATLGLFLVLSLMALALFSLVISKVFTRSVLRSSLGFSGRIQAASATGGGAKKMSLGV